MTTVRQWNMGRSHEHLTGLERALLAEVERLRDQVDAQDRQLAARNGENAGERLWHAKAERLQARIDRARALVKTLPTIDPLRGFTGPPDDMPSEGDFVNYGEWRAAEGIRQALDGEDQE